MTATLDHDIASAPQAPSIPGPAPSFSDRVLEQVASVRIRPGKLLLTILALPFYLLGWLLGLVFVAVLFAYGAAKVGIADARGRLDRRPADSDGPA